MRVLFVWTDIWVRALDVIIIVNKVDYSRVQKLGEKWAFATVFKTCLLSDEHRVRE
jgi:hypothetical protein